MKTNFRESLNSLKQFAVRFFKAPGLHPERYVLLAGLAFGLLFVFMIAPMQGADEPNHFMRAYQISKLDIVSERIGDSTGGINPELRFYRVNIGGKLPSGIVDLAQASYDMHGEYDLKMTRQRFSDLAKIQTGTQEKNAAFPNTAAYSPVAYAPNVVGIWLGRLIHANPLVIMYMARLAGLFAGIAILAFAVYLMPFAKLPFSVIALLPMTIGEMAVVSADTMAISLSFLLVATTLHYCLRKRDLSSLDWVILAGVCSALALSKPALLPLTIITFGLFINKAIPRFKALAIALSCIIASVGLALLWNSLVKEMVIFGYHQTYLDSNYHKQVYMLLHHPSRYFNVLYEAFLTNRFNIVITSMIGVFGWLDTLLPTVAVASGIALIALAIFIASQHDGLAIPKWFRGVLFMAGAGIVMVTSTLLFLLTMSPKSGYNLGLQGRYLIPALGVFAVTLAVGKKKNISAISYDILGRRCMYGSILLLSVMTCVLALRYY